MFQVNYGRGRLIDDPEALRAGQHGQIHFLKISAPEKLIVEETLREALAKVYVLPYDGRKIILLENDLPDNY